MGLHVATGECRANAADIVASVQHQIATGGGPTLWLELPRSVDDVAIEAHLLRRGGHVSNASAAYIGEAHLHGFRIAYAYLPEEQMRAALTILGDAVRTLAR